MSTIPAINAGIQGINKGMDGLRRNAHDTATLNTPNSPTSPSDAKTVTETLLDMKSNELQVEMSAKAVKAADDMIGTIIDIKA